MNLVEIDRAAERMDLGPVADGDGGAGNRDRIAGRNDFTARVDPRAVCAVDAAREREPDQRTPPPVHLSSTLTWSNERRERGEYLLSEASELQLVLRALA